MPVKCERDDTRSHLTNWFYPDSTSHIRVTQTLSVVFHGDKWFYAIQGQQGVNVSLGRLAVVFTRVPS